MFTNQRSSSLRSISPRNTSEPFNLNGVAECLNENQSLFDTQQIDSLYCDPCDVSKDLYQNDLPASGGRPNSGLHASDPAQGLETFDPVITWPGWLPDPGDFSISGSSDNPPRQLSDSTDASEQSDDFDNRYHIAMPPHDMDILRPVDSALPSPEQDKDNSEHRYGKISPQERRSGLEPVDTSGLAWRRAKNRTAASKCRAKQKVQAKALQREYEQTSTQNAYLKRQEQILRGLVTSLRDYALQHDPSRCRCESLHAFNIRRAEHISRGMDCLFSSSI